MITADIWWDGRWWDGPGIIWAILGMVASAAVWIVLFAVIIMMVKRRPISIGESSALRILEERYARGEISRDEFMERRDVLTGRSSAPTSAAPPGSPPPSA